jgi:hypothetical protein
VADAVAGHLSVPITNRAGEIQAQLQRMLENPHFSHSRRFPTFLRFVVSRTLAGQTELLKERTIGIEVFGKDPDYDTASDPIVRVTAAEIRKRIAQYYQESGHEQELKISLPPGSYVPQFHWPRNSAEAAPTAEAVQPSGPTPEPQTAAVQSIATAPDGVFSRQGLLIAVGVVAFVILAALGWQFARPRPSALDRFWAPVFRSGEPVALCFPEAHSRGVVLRDALRPEQQTEFNEDSITTVATDDLQPLASLTGLIELHHQRYFLVGDDTASLTDLRQGPAILVGAFDNAWTLRVTHDLRYRFGNDAAMKHFWIEDTQSAQHTHWEIDRQLQLKTNTFRDYALVARYTDANTGKLVVISAGIARGGTVAAGEFLTTPSNMELIKSQAPAHWDKQNMEFVLSTEIINGRSSPPKVEAAYFW